MKSESAVPVLYVEGNVDGTVGGSYYSLFFLVSGLDRRRYEPIVVFAAENALRPRFETKSIRTLVRPMPPPTRIRAPGGKLLSKAANFIRGWLIEPFRLAGLLRRERIRLLHLNNSITRNHTWTLAALISGIPVVTHERGINDSFKSRDSGLGRRMHAVICISAAVRDNFVARGLADLPLTTIHNGLDPAEMRVTRSPAEIRAEFGIAQNVRLVGMVGNIKAWKGQEVVIRAMGLLREEFPELACLLIGDTSPDDAAYRDRMNQLIEELGLAGRVLITGWRTDVANYANALDIQIHASIAPEPFGRVLLEAMALGKPVVASGEGAVPEIVADGLTGLLFTPGDSTVLANHVRALLRDPERAAQMGRAGRERVERLFSISHNVKTTQSLYDEILGSRRQASTNS